MQAGVASPNPLVLWIEDDPSLLSFGRALLAANGWDLICAASGSLGLALARGADIGVVLLDLKLPDISGLDVLRRLRNLQVRRPVPVVVLTAYGDREGRLEALRLGAAVVLRKPVRDAALIKALQRALTKSATDSRSVAGLVAALLHQFSGEATESALALGTESRSNERQFLLRRILSDQRVSVPLFWATAALHRATVGASGLPETLVLAAIERALNYQRPHDPRVAVAIGILEEAGGRCRVVRENDVADRLGLDAAHLGRLMVRATGCGFRAWRLGLRLRRAAHLIATTNSPISHISVAAGFAGLNGPTTFGKAFRRVLGTSPGRFRQACRRDLKDLIAPPDSPVQELTR
jgi:DNA-binding response OmpR family regulator/AraC-like DNA-binding protein